jgi:hypothetical protein
MNSFGAVFLLRFRPFQSSFLPFSLSCIQIRGLARTVSLLGGTPRNIEQTLCRFLDSYAEKDNGRKGDWREEGAMVPKCRTIGETASRSRVWAERP